MSNYSESNFFIMKNFGNFFLIIQMMLFIVFFNFKISAQVGTVDLKNNCGIQMIVENVEDISKLERVSSESKGFHFSLANLETKDIKIKIEVIAVDPNAKEYTTHKYQESIMLSNRIVLYGINDHLIQEKNDDKSYMILVIPANQKLDLFISQYPKEMIESNSVNFSKLIITSEDCRSLELESLLQSEFPY